MKDVYIFVVIIYIHIHTEKYMYIVPFEDATISAAYRIQLGNPHSAAVQGVDSPVPAAVPKPEVAQVELPTQEVAPEGPKVAPEGPKVAPEGPKAGCWGWNAGSLELSEKHNAIKPKRYIGYQNSICKTYMCIFRYMYRDLRILEVLPIWCLAELLWNVYKTLGKGFGAWVF